MHHGKTEFILSRCTLGIALSLSVCVYDFSMLLQLKTPLDPLLFTPNWLREANGLGLRRKNGLPHELLLVET